MDSIHDSLLYRLASCEGSYHGSYMVAVLLGLSSYGGGLLRIYFAQAGPFGKLQV